MDFGSDKITGRSIKPIDPGPFYTTPSPPLPSPLPLPGNFCRNLGLHAW